MGEGQWEAITTGDPVISHVEETDLLSTVFQTLLLTLGAVFLFLTLADRLTGNTITVGLVTVTPVVLAVTLILGSMAVLDVSFNVLMGTITSLTSGLRIAYSIHVSSRYTHELERQGDGSPPCERLSPGPAARCSAPPRRRWPPSGRSRSRGSLYSISLGS